MLHLALPFLLLACTPRGPGFAGGGEPGDETFLGDADTGAPLLDDPALLDCMERGGVSIEHGASPPDVQGAWIVTGELVASDSEHPEGSETSGRLCIREQDELGALGLSETAATTESWSTWGAIRGRDQAFTIWLELEGDDPHDPDCRVLSLAAITGERDDDALAFRSATVPVAFDDCEAYDPDSLGSCWATAATATRTGDCGG
jgi:hypothetical protein